MKILGLTDAVNTCDCCGKKNLKRTVAVEQNDGGIEYYGVICASNKHLNKTLSQIRSEAQENKESYCKSLARKASKTQEYSAYVKAKADAKTQKLKLKARADFIRPYRHAFESAISRMIDTNIVGVTVGSITTYTI